LPPAMARIERRAGVFLREEPKGGGRSAEVIWRSPELLDLDLHDISVNLEGENRNALTSSLVNRKLISTIVAMAAMISLTTEPVSSVLLLI
jgi:hypothetical protein